MRRVLCLVSTFVTVLLLVGCGGRPSGTAAPTQQTQFTALHVLRTSIIAAYHIRPFETNSARVAEIAQLYSAIQRLQASPQGYQEGSCPLDRGVDYELTFVAGGYTRFLAAVPIGGCPRVILGNGQVLELQSGDFWTTFEAATSMSASTIWDYTPAPHPPYAPKPTIPTFLSGYAPTPTPPPTFTSQP